MFDKKEVLQAAASFKIRKDALCIETIGSMTKGGGFGIMKEAVRVSRAAGFDGALELYAVGDPQTIVFYDMIGFISKPGAKDGRNLWLSPEAAARLMKAA